MIADKAVCQRLGGSPYAQPRKATNPQGFFTSLMRYSTHREFRNDEEPANKKSRERPLRGDRSLKQIRPTIKVWRRPLARLAKPVVNKFIFRLPVPCVGDE